MTIISKSIFLTLIVPNITYSTVGQRHNGSLSPKLRNPKLPLFFPACAKKALSLSVVCVLHFYYRTNDIPIKAISNSNCQAILEILSETANTCLLESNKGTTRVAQNRNKVGQGRDDLHGPGTETQLWADVVQFKRGSFRRATITLD